MTTRNKELKDKLFSLGARYFTNAKGPNGSELHFYRLNRQMLIVQFYEGDHGYEVYGPIFKGLEVKGTFDALDEIAQ